MPNGRVWTPEEIEFLDEHWGKLNIPQLAQRLNRSENAVKIKTVRYGLGKAVDRDNSLTARQVSYLMGVDIHAVTDRWVGKLGLKARKRAPHGQRKQTWIRMDDLVPWLKAHQDIWDSRRVELFAFGTEPKWLKEKRARDKALPEKRFKKWTPDEDKKLLSLYKTGRYTIDNIAEQLDRSPAAIEHRVMRLDVWGNGKYIGNRNKREGWNRLAFSEYWQKDMCMHWCNAKGCTAGKANCDTCASFQRNQSTT